MKRPVFRTTRRIEFRFMEAAEVEFLRSRGLSVAVPWKGEKIGFPRVAAACDYLQPARFQDVLDVAVKIRRIGRKSVTYGFEFSLGDQIIARGKITSVCCRVLEEHQLDPITIPAALRRRLKAVH